MSKRARIWAGFWFIVASFISFNAIANTLIDANTATEEQLQSIAGIGPMTAQRIIQARQRKPFKDLRDFADRVPGVGPKRLKQYSEAGLVVKRTAPLQTASASPNTRIPAEADSKKPVEPTETPIPVISVIEGGLRESSGKPVQK